MPESVTQDVDITRLGFFLHLLDTGQNVGVTSVQDGHGRAAEELTAGSTELNL